MCRGDTLALAEQEMMQENLLELLILLYIDIPFAWLRKRMDEKEVKSVYVLVLFEFD